MSAIDLMSYLHGCTFENLLKNILTLANFVKSAVVCKK